LKPSATTPVTSTGDRKVAARHQRRSSAAHRVRAKPSAAERASAPPIARRRSSRRGAYLNAVQVYPFSEGRSFHVFTAPGQVTDIALQPGETLGAVAAGDTVRWVIGDTTSGSGDQAHACPGEAVRRRPFDESHHHHRSARLSPVADQRRARRDGGAVLDLSAGPAHRPEGRGRAGACAQPVASGLQLDQLHFNYIISGDQPDWRPLRAFDDGRQTFIEFPENLGTGEAPPLFLVDAKGTASLVNYRVQGRFYVVDRLFDAAELRLGLKHQDVVRISPHSEADTRSEGVVSRSSPAPAQGRPGNAGDPRNSRRAIRFKRGMIIAIAAIGSVSLDRGDLDGVEAASVPPVRRPTGAVRNPPVAPASDALNGVPATYGDVAAAGTAAARRSRPADPRASAGHPAGDRPRGSAAPAGRGQAERERQLPN
jgi:type IV secretory pathway VirB9-like protein